MLTKFTGTNQVNTPEDKWVAVVALSAIFMSAVVAIIFIAYHFRSRQPSGVTSFYLKDGKVEIPQLGIELKHFPVR